MKTLDRYIIRNFLVSVGLWLIVLMSLRTAIDMIVSIDEFAEQDRNLPEMLQWMASYYGYQSLLYLAEMGGLIIVAGAVFSLYRMNRANELTAVLASGVSLHRVLWPLIISATILSGIVFLDREFVVPRVAHKLVRERDTETIQEFTLPLRADKNNATWYSRRFHPATELLEDPVVVMRDSGARATVITLGASGRKPTSKELARAAIRSGWAIEGAIMTHAGGELGNWPSSPSVDRVFTSIGAETMLQFYRSRHRAPEAGDMAGWTTDQVNGVIITAAVIPAKPQDGVYTDVVLGKPRFTFFVTEDGDMRTVGHVLAESAVWQSRSEEEDAHWKLTGGVLVIPTDLTTQDLVLRQSGMYLNVIGIGQVTRLVTLARERRGDARAAELTMHSRLAEPLNNLLLLLVAVPFILSRQRNVVTSALLCLLMGMAALAFIYTCRYVGLPPTWAAWLPLLVIGPIDVVLLDAVKT